MTILALRKQAALETLVISQIEALRKRESLLQKQIYSFSPYITSVEQIDFNQQIIELQQCADRLSRMMDAMSGYSSSVV